MNGTGSDNPDEGVEVLDEKGLPVNSPENDPRKNPIPRNLPALSTPTSAAKKGDLLAYYLAEVRRYPLLDPEEEKELAIQYQETGDPDAAHRLVTANLRLVVKLAFQYHRQWANVLDLIQEGNVGLVEALSRYDPYRGIRFSSYAQYWIRAMILRFLMDNYRMVRLGSTRHGRKLFFQLQKERDQLIKDGVQPSTLALARALDVPESEVVRVDQHLSAPAMSLDAPIGGNEGRPLTEVVSGEAVSPEDAAASGELGAIVQGHLADFATTLVDDRERAIWSKRLTSADPSSLSTLGKEFGVSKERIRQLEARIKRRLKAHLTQTMGDEIAFEFDVPED
ncbi:MAG: sigma-70 family RNA polymerase sigma factor [Myxococcota bacterium]|nr:sigma-70 family RNA polymerase sigma factor [Myxococcota bacterium]